jgi:hypothetical protein
MAAATMRKGPLRQLAGLAVGGSLFLGEVAPQNVEIVASAEDVAGQGCRLPQALGRKLLDHDL